MTVVSDHVIPTTHRGAAHLRATGTASARVPSDPARRALREQALARLAQRTMPLPGRPFGVVADDGTVSAHDCTCGRHRRSDTAGPRADLPRPRLSDREIEVLRTWMHVDSKSAVGERLYISLGTVNTHLARIRVKYGDVGRAAPTKAALFARAVQDGIIALDEL
ncbi:helix-turn-helix transcriptional regulator [Williamsia sterculiae]|uniref:DNA-binding transcriptional regulator, CsgD family n=1 Tax=Williamsia sterculiae TaxID=1344003 RepID=A0A1N7EGE7_9NOCA|nr:LuxR C-terminal-related transcriptional regulator [Williamsia sterculiae]SIR87171.1 DNA-binding transcriptional regulator, CsgD family [Williamsia sterculiae]